MLIVLSLAACTDDSVPLRYGLEAGRTLEYRLVLEAEVEGTLEGRTRAQDVVATFLVTQDIIESRQGGGAGARMTLTPEYLTVDGAPVDPGAGQEFEVELGPDGRVISIGEAAGEERQELAPLGIDRLLPRLRPVLPGAEVAPGDTWSSETEFTDDAGTFSLASESRLAELGVVGGVPAALVRTSYRSPVDRMERFANAVADLAGADMGAQEAWFALDGFLLRAAGDSVGTYRVTFRPPEGELGLAPVQGSLVVRLHTSMELIETG
jgi:hypothetical protein